MNIINEFFFVQTPSKFCHLDLVLQGGTPKSHVSERRSLVLKEKSQFQIIIIKYYTMIRIIITFIVLLLCILYHYIILHKTMLAQKKRWPNSKMYVSYMFCGNIKIHKQKMDQQLVIYKIFFFWPKMQGEKKSRRLFRESLTATTNHKSIYSVEFSKKKVLKSSSIINAFTSMKPNSDPPPWR